MLPHPERTMARRIRAQGASCALIENVSRRSVLKGMTGFVLAMHILPRSDAAAFPAYTHGGLGLPNGVVSDPHIFVSLAPDGTVTIVAHRAEAGTGSKTSIPMIIADEMEADWSRVKIVQAPGDEPRYGNQETDRLAQHSPSHPAGARDGRLDAAHARGSRRGALGRQRRRRRREQPPGRCTRRSASASAMAISRRPRWRCRRRRAIRSASRTRKSSATSARASCRSTISSTSRPARRVYAADVSLPGMKYAVVARPPVVGGTVRSVDDAAAKAIPGVEAIIQIPGAPHRLGIQAARRRRRHRHEHLGGDPGPRCARHRMEGRQARLLHHRGSMRRSSAPRPASRARRCAIRATRKRRSPARRKCSRSEYYQRHNVHSPMEPPAALANFADGEVRGVGLPAESLRRAPRHRRFPRHRCVKRHGERDAARRRLRTQVEGRLRHRGGLPLARGRRAGPRAMDARGRHPARLLPHDIGGADRDRPRRGEQAGRLAAAKRGAVVPVDLRAG